jgi:hypothetical protein
MTVAGQPAEEIINERTEVIWVKVPLIGWAGRVPGSDWVDRPPVLMPKITPKIFL